MQVKSRHHLRSDEIETLEEAVGEKLGVTLDGETYERVEFVGTDRELVLVDGEPLVTTFDGEWFLTVRGANVTEPTRGVVTVDAGAVQFVSDGANVMRPGIVETAGSIDVGDLVVIVEETHGKALAVGRAEVSGDEMLGEEGMVIESIHHVGDDLYEFDI